MKGFDAVYSPLCYRDRGLGSTAWRALARRIVRADRANRSLVRPGESFVSPANRQSGACDRCANDSTPGHIYAVSERHCSIIFFVASSSPRCSATGISVYAADLSGNESRGRELRTTSGLQPGVASRSGADNVGSADDIDDDFPMSMMCLSGLVDLTEEEFAALRLLLSLDGERMPCGGHTQIPGSEFRPLGLFRPAKSVSREFPVAGGTARRAVGFNQMPFNTQ